VNRQATIGAVARAAGVNVQTVRYYERRGLVRPAFRRPSGYRIYDADAARKIRFVKRAQDLGFSLAEIAVLLRLRAGRGVRCERVRVQAARHLKDVRERIRQLRSIEAILDELIRTCDRNGETGSCPILDSLDRGPDERLNGRRMI
jgi:Hg(II)-responsive transcriptional regulator